MTTYVLQLLFCEDGERELVEQYCILAVSRDAAHTVAATVLDHESRVEWAELRDTLTIKTKLVELTDEHT